MDILFCLSLGLFRRPAGADRNRLPCFMRASPHQTDQRAQLNGTSVTKSFQRFSWYSWMDSNHRPPDPWACHTGGTHLWADPHSVDDGIFHSKIIILLGPNGPRVAVGSGNLTFNGRGGNLEMLDYIAPGFSRAP
jgi:hypothetical protein